MPIMDGLIGSIRDIDQIFDTLDGGLSVFTGDPEVLKREFIGQELREFDFDRSLTLSGNVSDPQPS